MLAPMYNPVSSAIAGATGRSTDATAAAAAAMQLVRVFVTSETLLIADHAQSHGCMTGPCNENVIRRAHAWRFWTGSYANNRVLDSANGRRVGRHRIGRLHGEPAQDLPGRWQPRLRDFL